MTNLTTYHHLAYPKKYAKQPLSQLWLRVPRLNWDCLCFSLKFQVLPQTKNPACVH